MVSRWQPGDKSIAAPQGVKRQTSQKPVYQARQPRHPAPSCATPAKNIELNAPPASFERNEMKTFAELGFPGRLIAVEGLDGSGKSTQIYLLKRWLEAEGVKV